ncbi:BppU family phage baseplate upper protein [Enterococcus faecium]|uniref:BppU family phage baseplate upper protein n=1 Tax=Enterococcus faecium TaxID=1352 RepID=UPI003D6AFB91
MTITGFTFKSYDKKAGVLQFEIKNQDGSPTDLIDATVRLFMYIYQGEEKKEFPIFDNQIITESYMQGVVKYPIPDMLLSYEGKVDANVYIDFPDGSHTDNLAFTFNIEKSVIDDNVQLNGEYYFKDFQQLLDGVKQEATDAVNAALTNVDSTIEKVNQQINEFVEGATQAIDQTVDEVTEQLQATQTKIDTVSQNVTSAQNNLKAVEDKMNQTNQQIGDLGKLKRMYSNSIDFGGYDYSGNPNLIANINADSFSQGTGALSVVDDGDEVVVTLDPNHKLEAFKVKSQPALLTGKTYTMSVEIMLEDDFTGDPSKIGLRYIKMPNWVSELYTRNTLTAAKGVWQKLTGTAKITATSDNAESWFIMLQNKDANNSLSGKLRLRHAKVEAGSTATPYQPNLLDAPYYLSKVPLGENILKPASFPINTTEYMAANFTPNEPYVQGQKYTFTMKASKPSTQTFGIYLRAGSLPVGNMVPVEGLADVWQLTFEITQSHIDGSANALNVFQAPQSTKGTVNIEWAKLEKGDTRTPNISEYKYFGEGLKDSNNPNDYSWDITPEYTEKTLNNTVSLTEPQSVEGLKNFEDGLQIAGKEVATVPEDTGWVNLTAINGHSWNKQGQIRRIGKLVMFRGSLKGSTLSTQDFCTIPEGFRPSNPTDNYEYQFLLPPQSSNTLDNGGMAYIRPNGVCGLPSFRGTVNLFLAPIQYYID